MGIVSRRFRQPQPRNNGSVNIARSSIDQITPLAVRQQQNAIAVDGFPVLYYRRKTTGLRCSCCGAKQDQPIPTIVPGTVEALQPDGKGTANYLASVLSGSVFSIDRYGSRPLQIDANGGDNPQRSTPSSPLVRELAVEHHTSDLDDPFGDVIEPTDIDDLYDTRVENNVAIGAGVTACGVCLGTGYVGGYDCFNAMRTIYDTQYADWSGDFHLDESEHPASFVCDGAEGEPPQALLPVLLPAGAIGIDCIRVWNNRTQLTNVRIEILTVGGYIPAGSNLVQKCDGLWHQLRILFDPNLESEFTHIEIQFDIGADPVYADWGPVAFNENLQTMDNMANVSVVLSSTVPNVGLKDIICEDVHNRAWAVVDYTGGMDREKQLHGWDVSTRVIQKQELASLLPHRRLRTYYTGNQVAREPRDVPGEHVIEPYTTARQTKVR